MHEHLSGEAAPYRLLFDEHPLPTWVFALDSLRFLAVNEAAVREFGYARSRLLEMSILDVRPPGDHESLGAVLERSRARGGVQAESVGVWRLLRADGACFEAELTWLPVHFGGVAARMVVARDVTRWRRLEGERRAALAQALLSREQLERTLRRMDDGFFTLDRGWTITFANDRALRLLAPADRASIVGRNIWEVVPEARDQSWHRACESALATQRQVVHESFGERGKRWYESRIFPDAQGLSVYFTDITERRQMQHALERGERQYRLLFERHPNPMWVYDARTLAFLSVNEAAVARYGYSREEFLALTIADIRPSEDLPRLLDQIGRRRQQPGADDLLEAGVWRHRLKGGEEIDVEITSCDIDFDGRAARLVLAVDVTQRVAAERALRESERDFRLLAERMPGIVYRARLGPEPRTEYVSPRIAELGYDPSEWLANPALLWQSVHPDDRERLQAEVSQAVQRAAGPVHFEYRMRAANGQWRHVSDHAQVVRTADGDPAFMLGVNIDVTERSRARAELQAASAFRQQLVEQLVDGVLVLDPALVVLDANAAACRMLGRDKAVLAGQPFSRLLAPADRLRLRRELPAMLAGHPPFGIWDLLVAGDRTLAVEASVRALEGGEHLMLLRDATQRRATEAAQLAHRHELEALSQRLLTQEQETTRRLAQMLHDHLGQNLATARLFLEELQAAAGRALPDDARAAAERLERILDDATRQTRMAMADLRPPHLEEEGLARAVEQEIRARHAPGSQPEVRLEAPGPAGTQRWPAEVEYAAFMIVREALTNAWLHAGARSVRVHIDGDADRLDVEVVDDGRGIGGHVAGRPGHLGLVGMRERALAIGAEFELAAPSGGGTRVVLRWQR